MILRSFACSGQESTEPWASPSAAQLTFQPTNPSIGEVLSPPLSPPGLNRGPQRHIGRNSALKLITSFDNNQPGNSKFFSQADDGQTPIAAGPTPIIESAIDRDVDPATAVMRSTNRSGFSTPTSSKSFASSAFSGRQPLPSIGESHKEGATAGSSRRKKEAESVPVGMSIKRSATASPMMMRDGKLKITTGEASMPPPDSRVTAKMQDSMHKQRNGSRGRIPEGLNLRINSPSVEDTNPTSPSVTSSARYHWPSRRRGPGSVSSVTTASTSRSARTTGTGGRHLESYIHSLDAASDRKTTPRGRNGSRERHGNRGPSEERGRTPVRTYPAKRSPTSPVPMSPEELGHLNSSARNNKNDPIGHRKASGSRTSSRGGSRRPSRSQQDAPQPMAPPSPPPLSAVPQLNDTEDEEDYVKAVEAQEKFRQRHNKSRGVPTPVATEFPGEFPAPPAGRSRRTTSESNQTQYQQYRGSSLEHMGDLKSIKEERQRKKEQAARELEQRRKELSRNAEAGTIPHPNDIAPLPFRLTAVEMPSRDIDSPPRSRTADPIRSTYGRGPMGSAQIGLPATPKAMRLVLDSDHNRDDAPSVPPIPASFAQARSDDRQASSPEKEQPQASPQNDAGPLTLLPSTVYQPPRGPIPRSMSAPIPDDIPNRNHSRSGQPHSGATSRNQSVMGGHGSGDYKHGSAHKKPSSGFVRRGSYDDQVPPPPPPPPPAGPMLKELQHLAVPPPPPPAPLPHVAHNSPSPRHGSIEVVMDDDEQQQQEQQAPPPPPPAPQQVVSSPQSSMPIVVPSTEITVPVLPPPAPPSGKGHSRGRSATENSIAGRISKATERLRSASRTRKDNPYRAHKSPEPAAPYESILSPVTYNQMGMRSPATAPIDPHNLPTGLNKSDLI